MSALDYIISKYSWSPKNDSCPWWHPHQWTEWNGQEARYGYDVAQWKTCKHYKLEHGFRGGR